MRRNARTTGGCSRRGFTLVELLVVIGIISVLVSILLPALGRVRDQATSVKCTSNMRQIAIGAQMYAEANRGYFPRRWQSAGETDAGSDPAKIEYYQTNWSERLRPYVGKKNNPAAPDPANDGGKDDLGWVFHCPAVEAQERLGDSFPSAYGINTFMHVRNDNGDPANWGYHRRGIGKRSSELILFADKVYNNVDEVGTLEPAQFRGGFVTWSVYDAGSGRWIAGQYPHDGWAAPAVRHLRNTVANVAFFDGHVEGLRKTELSITSGRWNNWSPRE